MSHVESQKMIVNYADIWCKQMSTAFIYATKEVSASAIINSNIQIAGGARIKKRSQDSLSSIDAL